MGWAGMTARCCRLGRAFFTRDPTSAPRLGCWISQELDPTYKKQPPRRLGRGLREVLAGRMTGFPPRQDALRFSADVLPRLVTSSYSTVWPSLSVPRPARSTAEIWTNTSLSPADGRMNP